MNLEQDEHENEAQNPKANNPRSLGAAIRQHCKYGQHRHDDYVHLGNSSIERLERFLQTSSELDDELLDFDVRISFDDTTTAR